MSRTKQDWIKQRDTVIEARDRIHDAQTIMENYQPWHTILEEHVLNRIESLTRSLEAEMHTLVGICTPKWVVEDEKE